MAFWMADAYYYYSGCIILIQAISIAISMVQTRRVSMGWGKGWDKVGGDWVQTQWVRRKGGVEEGRREEEEEEEGGQSSISVS